MIPLKSTPKKIYDLIRYIKKGDLWIADFHRENEDYYSAIKRYNEIVNDNRLNKDENIYKDAIYGLYMSFKELQINDQMEFYSSILKNMNYKFS